MLETSKDVPSGWDSDYTEDAIRRFVLRLKPHWVFFQEVPGPVPPFVEGYVLIRQQTKSHSGGNIVTLLREDLSVLPITHSLSEGFGVQSELHGVDTTIANVHLAPGKAGAALRLNMLERIRDATTSSRVLVVGDTNTRLAEEKKIGKLGLSGAKPPSATWDSRINRFRAGMSGFSAYYTRYFVAGNIQVGEVTVHDKPLNVDGKKFHLSDHFPLSAKFAIPAPEDNN